MQKRSILGTVGLYATAIVTCGLLLFPIYWMLVTALSPRNQIRAYPPKFWPDDPQWGVFAELLATQPFGLWM